MKSKILLILSIFIFTFWPTRTLQINEEQGVLVLDNNNIDHAIEMFSHLLVAFFTSWCLHCKTLLPEYSKAARYLRAQDYKVKLGKVDASLEKELTSRFTITSYPTLILFLNQKAFPYTGGRTESEIVNWLVKTTSNPIKTVEDVSQLEKMKLVNDLIIIYWGDNRQPEFQSLEKIAREIPDAAYISTTSKAIEEGYRERNITKFSLIRNFSRDIIHFNEEWNAAIIERFIREYQYPLIMDFGEKYTRRVFGDKNPLLILIDSVSQGESEDYKAFEKASLTLKLKILFASNHKDSVWGQRFINFFGGSKVKVPLLAILRPKDYTSDKFIHRGAITEDSIIKFVENFMNNKADISFKTEPLPKEEGSVKVIVGRTFRNIVKDPTKDVFILLYTPSCKFSKLMMPEWEALADQLKLISDLIIAKMDISANEAEGLQVSSTPSIFFYPSGNKINPLIFKEERTVEGFWMWLKVHLTVRFDPNLSLKHWRGNQEPGTFSTGSRQEDLAMAKRRFEYDPLLLVPPGMSIPFNAHSKHSIPTLSASDTEESQQNIDSRKELKVKIKESRDSSKDL